MDTNKKITKIGVIITEDAEHWGIGKILGDFITERIKNNCDNDDVIAEYFLAFSDPLPEDLCSYHGYIISGSHYSVNDDLEWLRKLERFIVKLSNFDERIRPKLYGICFGHQLIAKSLGGKVGKVKKFVIGANTLNIEPELSRKDFFKKSFGENCRAVNIFQSHGEEVFVLPPNALPVASSDTCKFEMLMYGEHILSSQGHPELTSEKLKKFILPRVIANKKLTDDEIQQASQAIENVTTDNLMKMVISFLQN